MWALGEWPKSVVLKGAEKPWDPWAGMKPPFQLEENNLPESAEPGSSPSVCWLLTWLFPLNSKRKVVFNKIIYSVSRNYSYLGINKTRKKELFSEIEPISFEDCVLSFFKEYNQGTIVILGFGEQGHSIGHSNFSKKPFSKKSHVKYREKHSKFPRLTIAALQFQDMADSNGFNESEYYSNARVWGFSLYVWEGAGGIAPKPGSEAQMSCV